MRDDVQEGIWAARGRCGGPVEPNEHQMGGKDDQGPYFSVPQFAVDAGAPCFVPNEKFRVCPVWLAGSPMAQFAFHWRRQIERGILAMLVPPEILSSYLLNAVQQADLWVNKEIGYQSKRKTHGNGNPQAAN